LSALAALLGAGLAAGILLAMSGLRPTDDAPTRLTGWRRRMPRSLAVQLTLAVVAGAVAGSLTGWPTAAMAAAVLGWFTPRMAGGTRRGRSAQTERIRALGVWTEMLRDGFGAGSLLASTIGATESVAPEAIATEVALLCRRVRRARPGSVETGLRMFAADLADPTADMIVITLLQAERGEAADMAPVLSALAEAASAEVNMRLEIEAKRAEILVQRRMIVGTIILLVAYMLVFRFDYLRPFSSVTGQFVLAVVVGIFSVSLWLMDRLSRLPVAERTMRPEAIR
jgi:tight adherence protein B